MMLFFFREGSLYFLVDKRNEIYKPKKSKTALKLWCNPDMALLSLIHPRPLEFPFE